MVSAIQQFIFLILGVGMFGIQIYALVMALRFGSEAYLAASKRTKKFWTILLIVVVAVGFVSLPPPIGGGSSLMILNLVALVGAGVFLADVLPALRQVGGRSKKSGPYGP